MRFIKPLIVIVSLYGVSIMPSPVLSAERYSPNLYGALGLNTVPSARMDAAGTVRLSVSEQDPYSHASLSFQLADALQLTLRQSVETSAFKEKNRPFYPGIDFKLRFIEESAWVPELAIGAQSAVGHKRQAGEYLAASKRYGRFDFTGGLGWGRYGTAGHFTNPLKAISNKFGGSRDLSSELPNTPQDWFTGEDVGLFGGIEYFTPWVEGLSIKADWGADRYSVETAAGSDFQQAAPWGIGLSYHPNEWLNASFGTQGGDKFMGRLSLQTLVQNWPWRETKPKDRPYFRPFRPSDGVYSAGVEKAKADDILIYDPKRSDRNKNTLEAGLEIKAGRSLPFQIGRAITHLANESQPEIEQFTLKPTFQGLKGPKISIQRTDFERAVALGNGSPEEIWQNTSIQREEIIRNDWRRLTRSAFARHQYKTGAFSFNLEQRLSLSEEDFGALTRTSILGKYRSPEFFGFALAGSSIRVNVHDNLDKIDRIPVPALARVRNDVDDFTKDRIALDTLYTHVGTSIGSDIHLGFTAGYVEEQYAAAGGEILYRPYGSRLALGAELWRAIKRSPDDQFRFEVQNEDGYVGHAQLWYEMPEHDLVFHARAGQFIAGDAGLSFSLKHEFDNGSELKGFTTITNTVDLDDFGGTTHLFSGMRFSVPLGSSKYLPENTRADLIMQPFARDAGQTLRVPIDLYEQTEPFSAAHIAQYWHEVTE